MPWQSKKKCISLGASNPFERRKQSQQVREWSRSSHRPVFDDDADDDDDDDGGDGGGRVTGAFQCVRDAVRGRRVVG